MNRLRALILVVFVGASFWVFAPLLNIGWAPPIPGIATAKDPYAGIAVPIDDGRRKLQTSDVQAEIALATVAAFAWVLAGMSKRKGA